MFQPGFSLAKQFLVVLIKCGGSDKKKIFRSLKREGIICIVFDNTCTGIHSNQFKKLSVDRIFVKCNACNFENHTFLVSQELHRKVVLTDLQLNSMMGRKHMESEISEQASNVVLSHHGCFWFTNCIRLCFPKQMLECVIWIFIYYSLMIFFHYCS